MTRAHVVQAILRRWDPIGVQPGERAPADEYDSYALRIVAMVTEGCSSSELSLHLEHLRTATMGLRSHRERDVETAAEIIEALRKT